ncbi:YchJ family protein [Amycolatopsis orientalis]|uniref:YchJ family protein n=1 Tax=Amycolatopsis orientalis TaxID=31958 RepID=UPI000ADBDD6E|nr:YchJ family metal-binding protein [Amycolatopsis orientalis]
MPAITDEARCPCGLGEPYGACCGRFHRGTATAPTAELLMRSRFSAFAVGDTVYLTKTWDPETRPADLELDPDQRWTFLEILGKTGGGLLENEGTVEFRAHYRQGRRADSMHENSRFARVDGQWIYVAPVG